MRYPIEHMLYFPQLKGGCKGNFVRFNVPWEFVIFRKHYHSGAYSLYIHITNKQREKLAPEIM